MNEGFNDWLKLTPRQREDVISLRDRMNRHLIAETEAFYVQHPGLKLMWSFVCDALIRVDDASPSNHTPYPYCCAEHYPLPERR